MDYDNTDDWKVYGKVAFQPDNSMMQEYDIDWDMPYDEGSPDVFDTESEIPAEFITQTANDFVKYWKEIIPDLESSFENFLISFAKFSLTELTPHIIKQ